MLFSDLCRPLVLRALAPAAILASALIGAPALACKNPALATPRPVAGGAGGTLVDESPVADPASFLADDALVDGVAEYLLASGNGAGSIIGMWHAIMRIGDANGPVYDEVFQQFHSDGTEMIVSNGLPPALGNVCIGVWKRTGPGTYKLRHMTWNWLPDTGDFGVPGTFAGHFELQVKLRVNGDSNGFRGNWKATNFDAAGNHLPELDAEGVMIGKRINPN